MRWFALLLLGLAAAGAQAAPKGSRWNADYFGNPILIDQDGHRLRFYDDLLKGKTVAINFIFTSCNYSCPLETAKLKQVAELLGSQMGKEVFFYSITLDPGHDTPKALRSYMKKYQLPGGWRFLTGNEADIAKIRHKLGLLRGEKLDEKPDNHNLSFLVGNEPTGQWLQRSPYDNPRALATVLGEQLQNYRTRNTTAVSYAQAPKMPNLERGEELYRSRCQSCHGLGTGDALGPDLLGITKQREHAWLKRWIMTPDKLLAEKDGLATALFAKFNQVTMPNLKLSAGDAEAIIRYLATRPRRAP